MAASSTRIHCLLVLSYVSCLALQAAALSFNYSSSGYPSLTPRYDAPLAIMNTTVAVSNILALGSCYCQASPQGTVVAAYVRVTNYQVDSSVGESFRVFIAAPLKPLLNCTAHSVLHVLHAIQQQSFGVYLSCYAGSLGGLDFHLLPGYTSATEWEWGSNRLRNQPATRRLLADISLKKRRLLSDTYGRSVASSWMEQASVAGSGLVGLICVVGAAGLMLCCCMCIRIKRLRQSTAAIELEDDQHTVREAQLRRGSGPRQFTYCEIVAATCDFAEERMIGRGGFGPVYRGYLGDQDRDVAIKALSQEQSVQGLKEFQAEITIMSQLRHRNIVRLVGWCGRRRGLALVYELVPGGSLDKHLYNPDTHLTWSERYKIALGLGSALGYLHTDCEQCVVHGDIKPANVMLDSSRNAKLGDFGLARLVDHGTEPQTTQVVAGTVGYIDPEFMSSRRPSTESDVYSFGVVLLEIACGRRPRPSGQDSAALLASVRDMYRRDLILDAADPRLDGGFDRVQMERLLVTGLWCAHHDPMERPSVTQAMEVLRSESASLPVLGAMRGSGEIHSLRRQAYSDVSAENSAYLHESTETAYLTTESSAHPFSSAEQ